uniref:leukotoxin LktA family filamentous adhesin n=1 Tax=Phascolarctobacterium succinatutens TaxID=626940 RepID=UPI003AF59562
MKVNRKFLRSAERLSLSAIAKDSVAQRVVSAVTAIGFVLQPVAALASTITRTDGGPAVNFNNNVADVFAGKVVGDVAINKFAEFQLDANNIANMYFGESKDSNGAANLVNFVDSRIDINGTVNAIQNKKIGGNLFFFSSDGMAVGKSGVINAGALYVATPTENAFKDYKNLKTEDQFKTIIKEEGFANIPINASGTISVLGKVNAVNAVNLRAAKIGVGKNVSENNIGDVAAGATATDASIRTGVVDFKDIVNIGKVNAGLTGKLTAKQDGSGDIVLAASNNYNDNYSMLDDFSKIAGAKVEAELSVANGAEVKATGNAKLSAQALNNVVVEKSDQYKENYTPSTTTNSHLYGQIVTTNATVNVDGTVEATQVDITADAVNRYVSAESSVLNASNVTSNIVGALTANLDASYAVLNSKAEVNVGQSAEINATGSDTVSAGKVVKPALNIKANSSVEAGAGASTALLKVMNVAGTNIIPAAAVTYSQTHNEAAVNIDGTLKSTGGTSVTALADSKVNSEAKATTMDVSENPNLGDVALNITTGDNKSSVTIGKTAQMTELQKDVTIEAKSVNSVIT